MQTTIVISIGRNISHARFDACDTARALAQEGGGEGAGRAGILPDAEWGDFQDEVYRAVAGIATAHRDGGIVFTGESLGVWASEAEESFTVIAVTPETALRGTQTLRRQLADIAQRYGQDAIALTVTTDTELVAAA